MNTRVLIKSIALLALTCLGIAFFMIYQLRNPKQQQPQSDTPYLESYDNPYSDFKIPPFQLLDRNAEPIDQTVLDNQFTVVDFFYTSCPLYCPVMSAEMSRVQEATKGTDLQLLSISIDGDIDTPQVINNYASAFKADPNRWRFATGTPESVEKIAYEGLKFHIRNRDQTAAAGQTQIEHPTKLILLGPDRSVIGLYTYNNREEIDELIETALKLVK
ncbi:MAG: SCO family protein [Phycisphaerales bacterium]|nr:SCO family protein [Phycisphaerales bacterium]